MLFNMYLKSLKRTFFQSAFKLRTIVLMFLNQIFKLVYSNKEILNLMLLIWRLNLFYLLYFSLKRLNELLKQLYLMAILRARVTDINHLIKMVYINNIFRLKLFVILIGIRIKIKVTILNLYNIVYSTYKTSDNYNKSLMYFKILNKTLQYLKFLKKTYLRRYTGLWKKCEWKNDCNKWIHFKNTILFFNKNYIIVIPFKAITYRLNDLKYK